MLQQGVVKDKTFLTGNEEEEERARQDRREAIIATAVCFVEMIVLLECSCAFCLLPSDGSLYVNIRTSQHSNFHSAERRTNCPANSQICGFMNISYSTLGVLSQVKARTQGHEKAQSKNLIVGTRTCGHCFYKLVLRNAETLYTHRSCSTRHTFYKQQKMAIFRVNVSHHATTNTDKSSQSKELRIRPPSDISSSCYKIKLPKQQSHLIFTKVGDYNTLLVDIPLSHESNKTLEGIRRQVMESSSTSQDSANPLNNFSVALNVKASEKIYHAEEIIPDTQQQQQQDNIIEDFKLLYRELTHWLAPKTKASNTNNNTRRQHKREDSEDDIKTGGGDRERLNDIWNDLIEALQWVALIHILFYSFLLGLALGVLFITDP